MTKQRFLNYGRHLVEEDDIAAVTAVLRGDLITQGPAVERFEAALAERCTARFAVAVSSGTAALHMACLAAGLSPGDHGLTSAVTFVASANCIAYAGGIPDLVDIDPHALGMSVPALAVALARTPETRVVIPVHLAGLAHASARVRETAGDRIVIEDASHALGGQYEDGRPIGCCAHSDMTVFSFHPVKPVTTGEGGAVTTNDPELARRLRILRSHGIERSPQNFTGDRIPQDTWTPWYYEQQMLGFNYRMTDIQAALGISQLGKLDRFLARRRAVAAAYDAAFASLPTICLPQSSSTERSRSGLHLYIACFDFERIGRSRGELMSKLAERGIGSQVHYIPVHHQPFHAAKLQSRTFPEADRYYGRCLSLPLYAGLNDEDVARVIEAVRDVASK